MRIYIVIAFAFCLALLCQPQAKADICSSVSTNMVLNCGFETGNFTDWTLSGNDVPGELGNLYGVEGTDPFPLPGGTAPNSGNFQAFFADQAADPTTLAQTLATVIGQEYTITFYLAQQVVGPGTVNNDALVKFGGATVENLSDLGDQGYTKYTVTEVATSTSTTLSFQFGDDIGEFLLDDVSVTTPEPRALPVLAAFLVAMMLIVRRRSSGAWIKPAQRQQ